MKKIFSTLAATLLFIPATVLAQKSVTNTHFEGQLITGVEASSAFEVVLVKSNQTKAVVETNDFLEHHVEVSRGADGVVRVGTRNWDNSINRKFNDLPDREKVMKLTLYLPSLGTIRLSGAVDLISYGAFTGEDVDISLSGASEINEINLIAPRVKLQCSGASEASLILPATKDLVVVASGASEISVAANGLAYSKMGISGASEVEIEGDGQRGDWTVSGASEIIGDRFSARDITVNVSGFSSARVNASEILTARASGASSIRYAGKPATFKNLSPDPKDVKPM